MNLVPVLVTVGLLAGSGSAVAEDSLDRRLQKLEPSAFNCGRVGRDGTTRKSLTDCVQKHFLANEPFLARYDSSCEDSVCAWGIVLQRSPGSLYIVGFDVGFDSIGCTAKTYTDPLCGTTLERCQKPKLIPVQGKGLKLVCTSEYGL